ncbi:MAG: DUF2608 domain-containing protein [Holosporales bacterium]|jgi:hypothetical protein|nr:DUF2608 domain-containing protein [Holosporales bacterium]
MKHQQITTLLLGACLYANGVASNPAPGESTVMSVTNAVDIQNVLRQFTGGDVLILFDCDDVLLAPATQIFRRDPKHTTENKNDFGRLLLQSNPNMSKEESLARSQTVLATSRAFLVSEKMPAIVEEVQASGTPCIVITALPPRPAPCMPDPVEWRNGLLSKFGFHFEKSWPDTPDVVLESAEGVYKPVFSKGVLFCGSTSKDKSLDAFLTHVKKEPKVIVLIDDSIKNIDAVNAYCKAHNIKFVGIHYTEYSKHDSVLPSSWERSEFQMKTLLEHDIWLPDEILPIEFSLDWPALCKKAIEKRNVPSTKELLKRVDKKTMSTQMLELAEQSGDKEIIECVTTWAREADSSADPQN